MLGHMLTPLAMAVAAVLNLTTLAVASPPPAPAAPRFDLLQLTFTEPAIFGVGGQGKPSPAGCHIIQPVQLPHVSTFEESRNSRREMKGKAFSTCNTPVSRAGTPNYWTVFSAAGFVPYNHTKFNPSSREATATLIWYVRPSPTRSSAHAMTCLMSASVN